jgi:hypothetical protein
VGVCSFRFSASLDFYTGRVPAEMSAFLFLELKHEPPSSKSLSYDCGCQDGGGPIMTALLRSTIPWWRPRVCRSFATLDLSCGWRQTLIYEELLADAVQSRRFRLGYQVTDY